MPKDWDGQDGTRKCCKPREREKDYEELSIEAELEPEDENTVNFVQGTHEDSD